MNFLTQSKIITIKCDIFGVNSIIFANMISFQAAVFTPRSFTSTTNIVNKQSPRAVKVLRKVKKQMLCVYSGREKFMPLPLKSKILETPGSLVTDDIKMLPF